MNTEITGKRKRKEIGSVINQTRASSKAALTALLLLLSSGLSSNAALAALYDRGGGLIYDDGLGITWLQDANYARTSGFDADGAMTWGQARAWADSLLYAGFDGWRLPSILDNPNVGEIDTGELGHMYFNNLGNTGFPAPLTSSFSDAETSSSTSFFNLQSQAYWYSEEYAVNTQNGWAFVTLIGTQGLTGKSASHFAWAVHDGDIGAIPLPAAAWLFGSALLGMVVTRRRTD